VHYDTLAAQDKAGAYSDELWTFVERATGKRDLYRVGEKRG